MRDLAATEWFGRQVREARQISRRFERSRSLRKTGAADKICGKAQMNASGARYAGLTADDREGLEKARFRDRGPKPDHGNRGLETALPRLKGLGCFAQVLSIVAAVIGIPGCGRGFRIPRRRYRCCPEATSLSSSLPS